LMELPLIKYLDMNTEYELPSRVSWVIERIGTDDDSTVEVYIDNKLVLKMHSTIAPLQYTDNNLLGPLDLGQYYLVVPEETKIKCVGTSGKHVSIYGRKLIHDPGERLGEPYASRFTGQPNAMVYFWEDTYSHGTDVAWAKDSEKTVLTIQPGGMEKYTVIGPVMVSMSGGTYSYGDFSLVLKLNGQRVEYLWQDNTGPGIDITQLPRPPTQNNWYKYTFGEKGLELVFGNKLEFLIRNVSGSDLSPSSGSEWKATITVLGYYVRLR